ncbi:MULTISPECIES: Rrf2 family transcriptional regulator [Streptomyces]|uniref:Rrf2 family transcriptional regulator n=1 Tax=Streptomyces TaxID=1883 RepID=UPI00099B3942
MRLSARADHAVRAALEPAAAGDETSLKAEGIAAAQRIPHKFPEGVLDDLRRGGLVVSRRDDKEWRTAPWCRCGGAPTRA